MLNVKILVIVLALTLISGFSDAQGFVGTSRVWQGGRFLHWPRFDQPVALLGWRRSK